jgi:hypothetical protein
MINVRYIHTCTYNKRKAGRRAPHVIGRSLANGVPNTK